MDEINWGKIHSLDGSKHIGFQELCVQLARAGSPEGAKFVSIGNPDAGVECYCVFPDGREWGWQAKYFLSALGNSQWQQIDRSVRTALQKHPNLVRYYICVPRNRSDARNPKQQSEMDRWNKRVAKWQAWAQDRGMDVEFVWWGSSELLDMLSSNENSGLRRFWFGLHEFHHEWFSNRLDEAIEVAGPRYTPKINVELEISKDLHRFSRSTLLFEEVKSLAIEIRRASEGIKHVQKSLKSSLKEPGIDRLTDATNKVLHMLEVLESSAAGSLPFPDIIVAATDALEKGEQASSEIWKTKSKQKPKNPRPHSKPQDPLDEMQFYLSRLSGQLRMVIETCVHADSLANTQLLLLNGEGGVGKTHLLCDFAKQRVDEQLPTILLMGQSFSSAHDPWAQMMAQLGLPEITAEEFVGALGSAAQTANSRALLIVDALNERDGRKIWPNHLSSFLARVCKSPWIGLVLAVRSSYEEDVIPENVQNKARHLTHFGFLGREYDAVRAYFDHYGLEFPSVPLLHPEFTNPLFLKTLCKGLKDKGETRLPRGFHGITVIFNLYLDELNSRLSNPDSLDYDPHSNLVLQALNNIAQRLATNENRSLTRTQAQSMVDSLLPGRDYSRSLYPALVHEGILTENLQRNADEESEEVVFIAYERFADHIIANHLLDTHLEGNELSEPFLEDLTLSPLHESRKYLPYGVVEALCIQIPERTGKELVRLAPKLMDRPTIGNAFLQSLIWRKPDAFSDDTISVLNELIGAEILSFTDPLDSLLTVSTVPNHRFNANFLDKHLRIYAMPDRDAWWSTYLHHAWGAEGPVDRLVDWALQISTNDDMEEDVVDLAATALAWMLTTPNRFLRDRATKALVALLSGRIESTKRLVGRFSDVDDLYVLERLYTVMYGVAMRSYDADAVGKLARLVYERVFASGSPPPHILLRDYARGVVERAMHLGADLPIDVCLIRPPYKSNWAHIPSEDDIADLKPNWDKDISGPHDLELSRMQIHNSVMSEWTGDFAKYVIGSESGSNWLSLSLDEDTWQSPEERLESWILSLNDYERLAWTAYQEAQKALDEFGPMYSLIVDAQENKVEIRNEPVNSVNHEPYQQARRKVEICRKRMMAKLTPQHRMELESIERDEKDRNVREGPRFDKRLIQRYIHNRVFDLGWTTERFGYFDRFSVRDYGRAANKPERMGKKYQWIAFHEILAYIADHHQYRQLYFGDGDRQYEGPWQENLRDIDPSCTLLSVPGGTGWGPHKPAWWGNDQYEAWREDSSREDWLSDKQSIPNVRNFLEVINPTDGSRWLNVDGSLVWIQSHPPDREPFDKERREVWFQFTGYFIRADKAEGFMSWARKVDFWGRWMPEPLDIQDVFLGEYGWSPAFRNSYSGVFDKEGWEVPRRQNPPECPASVQPVATHYSRETGGFDCSLDDTLSLRLPRTSFINHLNLKWSSNGADFLDANGNLVAFDPTAHENGPSALLLSKAHLEKYLQDTGLALCWVVVGEKWIAGGNASHKFRGRLKISGAYHLSQGGLEGFINSDYEPPRKSK